MKTKSTLLSVLFLVVWMGCAKPPPVLITLADFSLSDQTGQIRTKADFSGKVWVADFIFTSCPDVCPRLTQSMASLVRETGSWSGDLRFVSISVDPEVDTPERLKDYAQSFGADPTRWFFLTGSTEEIQKTVVDGFKQPQQKLSAFQIMHGERFVLVDPRGRIRGYYEINPEGLKSLKKNMKALLKEKN